MYMHAQMSTVEVRDYPVTIDGQQIPSLMCWLIVASHDLVWVDAITYQ